MDAMHENISETLGDYFSDVGAYIATDDLYNEVGSDYIKQEIIKLRSFSTLLQENET